jgi:hypothetical protein
VINAINNIFTTITEKLNIQQIEKWDTISVLKDLFPETSPASK